jgi:hypothetical protein
MIQNPLLEIRNRVERIRYVLILLYVANDFGSLGSFREIDQFCVLDNRCNAIFDESEISQIYTCKKLAKLKRSKWSSVPRNGMHGGLAS